MKRKLFLQIILIFLIVLLQTSYGREIDPLKEFIYTITVKNNENTPKRDIKVISDLTKIKGQIANNGENYIDIEENIFLSWNIYRDGEKINTIENEILEDTIVEIPEKSEVEYKIIAIPNPKILAQKVKNNVYIYENNQLLEVNRFEDEILESKPKIERIVDLKEYSPKEYIEYSIKIEPDRNGYLNNYKIDENIQDILVETLNGEKESIFSEYTVSINKELIDGEIDIAPNDPLVYTVKGKINENIVGDIEYKNLVTKARKGEVKYKFLNTRKYTPGEVYLYEIEIENIGKGNIKDLKTNFQTIGEDVTSSLNLKMNEKIIKKTWVVEVSKQKYRGT